MVQDLWGHVQWRTEDGLSSLILRTQQLSEAEVPDLDHPIVLEDVSQFEVAVHDLAFDQGLEGVKNLHEELKGFFLGELLLEFECG